MPNAPIDPKPYRSILLAKQQELLLRIAGTPAKLAVTPAADPLDAIVNLQLRESAVSENLRDRKLLAEVNDAIQRIAIGCYGECCGCGRQISLKRLNAVPSAPLCITCKEGETDNHPDSVAVGLETIA